MASCDGIHSSDSGNEIDSGPPMTTQSALSKFESHIDSMHVKGLSLVYTQQLGEVHTGTRGTEASTHAPPILGSLDMGRFKSLSHTHTHTHTHKVGRYEDLFASLFFYRSLDTAMISYSNHIFISF